MTSAPSQTIQPEIWTIHQLFQENSLHIPDYQRPYKWTSKHVYQLVADIKAHQNKSAYRLGTLVFHVEGTDEAKKLNIVDGQQRVITLLLLLSAIRDKINNKNNEYLCKNIDHLFIYHLLRNLKFTNTISQKNIYANYQELKHLVAAPDFDEKTIEFLLHKCQVVTFKLNEISEAFQFFDSQNSRGKALAPHDLLKAFHLREFSKHEEKYQLDVVERWEGIINKDEKQTKQNKLELGHLFSEYLYPIHQWLRNKPREVFNKDQIHCFKGISLEKHRDYPYTKTYRITDWFIDDYNNQTVRSVDQQNQVYPFTLDDKIINGRRFFERIHYYYDLLNKIKNTPHKNKNPQADNDLFSSIRQEDNEAYKILTAIDTYTGRHRKGDIYVRTLFECLLLYYIDKFSTAQLDNAIIKIFLWAYTVRLSFDSVYRERIDKHVLENNLFIALQDANTPNNFLSHPIEPWHGKHTDETKANELKKFFLNQ